MSESYDDILPNPGFTVERGRTALVITDPQRDFLSEDGVVWQVVGESVTENATVEHLARLLSVAHEVGVPVSFRRTTTIRMTKADPSVRVPATDPHQLSLQA